MACTFIESLRSRQDRPPESGGPEVDPTDVDSAVEEGHVDGKHVEDYVLSQHLTYACTCHMLVAPCAEILMLSREKSSTGVKRQKVYAPVSLP